MNSKSLKPSTINSRDQPGLKILAKRYLITQNMLLTVEKTSNQEKAFI